jgi:hypothetical protein
MDGRSTYAEHDSLGHTTVLDIAHCLAFRTLSRESKESLCGHLIVLMNIDERTGWNRMGKNGHLSYCFDEQKRAHWTGRAAIFVLYYDLSDLSLLGSSSWSV